MSVETEPMRLPDGEPDVDLDAYKIEQETPPREPRFQRKRSSPTAKATKATTARRVAEPPSKPGTFVEPLETIYSMVGVGVSMIDKPDHECGPVIAENAHDIAVKWDELAQKNPDVRRALRKLTQGSAWAGVIGAHVPVALAIIAVHAPGALPSQRKPADDQQSEDDQQPTMRRRTPGHPAMNIATNQRRSAV